MSFYRASLASSQGPPGYPSSNAAIRSNPPGSSMSTTTPADSVLELKRGLKNQSPATTSTSEDASSRGSSSGDNNREEDVNHEYQTMERPATYETSSFRPSTQNSTVGHATSTSNILGRQLPQVPGNQDRIPSVPGYAKPYARPFDAPPSPPPSPPTSEKATNKPLETNLDDLSKDTLNRSRSRSVGQILETNFDEPDPTPSMLGMISHKM